MKDHMVIQNPLAIIFEGPDKKVVTHIHAPEGYTHEHYGMIVCDFVRHVARAFKVSEEAVWEWVDKERSHPTSPIEQAN
jgi:hypothetical protein